MAAIDGENSEPTAEDFGFSLMAMEEGRYRESFRLVAELPETSPPPGRGMPPALIRVDWLQFWFNIMQWKISSPEYMKTWLAGCRAP